MKFNATIHKKFEVWQELGITFEAKDAKDAKEILDNWDGLPPDAEYFNTETLLETEEALTKEDNDGQPVWELQDLNED